MSNFTTNDKIDNPINKIKEIALNKADKAASKIPGYTKVKNITNKIKDAGFSVDVGKDKIGINFKKKF
jgi:carbon monoxide dehydrogenase subunit G|tara:strand:+ start:159 stop:362 length:204 start_codon:yes stop_codon:yes gene_type:complete